MTNEHDTGEGLEQDLSADLITLLDEDGQQHDFEIIDEMDLDDEHYVALIPHFDDPEALLQDDAELIILKSILDGDEEFLEAIEDEAEFDKAAAIFTERLEEMDYTITDNEA